MFETIHELLPAVVNARPPRGLSFREQVRVNDGARGMAKKAVRKSSTAAKKAVSGPRKRSAKAQRERVLAIIDRLKAKFPVAECALTHRNEYELLAATILSAQCTDERVNMVTPELFAQYPTAQDLARASQEDVETIIRSTGFFRAKAENLRGMARCVVEKHGGRIPETLDELIQLPGVGRKTANVLLGTWHRIPSGVVVDTHVKRISRLLGLTTSESPEAIEQDLIKLLPKEEWIDFSHRLIHHGRQTCIARRPKCTDCVLIDLCDRVGLPSL